MQVMLSHWYTIAEECHTVQCLYMLEIAHMAMDMLKSDQLCGLLQHRARERASAY